MALMKVAMLIFTISKKGSRTGNFRDPLRTACSRMCGAPVSSSAGGKLTRTGSPDRPVDMQQARPGRLMFELAGHRAQFRQRRHRPREKPIDRWPVTKLS